MSATLLLPGICLALALVLPSMCLASAPAHPLLTIAAQSAGESASHPGVYDAGTLDSMKDSEIRHTFTVRNPGTAPVAIDSITSSCGCTTALIESGSRRQSLPFTLAPGRSAEIRVEVSVEGEAVGSLDKFVWIHAHGEVDPGAILEVKAVFPPLVVLTPQTIDFGRVRAGSAVQRTIYATVSPRLMADQPFIALAGSLPYLAVGPPAAAGTAPPPAGESGPWPRLAYTISLAPNAPIGAFADDLSVELARIGAMSQLSEQGLGNDFVVVRGEVFGDILVAPRSVVFGTVEVGNGAAKDILLTAVSPAILSQVKVASDSPWVSIQPKADRSGVAAGIPQSAFTVTISPSAPAATLEAKITFTTASGQTLVLPVLAYISTNSAP